MAHRSARGRSAGQHPPHAPWKPHARVPISVRIQHGPRISARAAGPEPQALPCATQHKSRQIQYESKIKKVDLRKSTETTRNQRNRSRSPFIPEINSGRYFNPPSRAKRLRNRACLFGSQSGSFRARFIFTRTTRGPRGRAWCVQANGAGARATAPPQLSNTSQGNAPLFTAKHPAPADTSRICNIAASESATLGNVPVLFLCSGQFYLATALLACPPALAQLARGTCLPHIRGSGGPKRKNDLYRTGDQNPRHPRQNFTEFRVGMNCIEPPDQRTRRPSVNWFPLRRNDLQFKRKPLLARKQRQALAPFWHDA